jgi:tetratricopeptide (TPR) repeat protein
MRAGSTLQVLRVCAFALLTASCAQAVPQQGTSPAEIFRRVRSSVVVLVAVDAKGEQIVQGSGFIVGPNLIATNHHVLSDTSGAYAVFADGQSEEVTGVVADSEAKDLALKIIVGTAFWNRPKNPDLWRQRLIRLEAINPGAGWVLMAKAMDDFRAEKSDDALAKIQAAKRDSFPDAAPFRSLAAYYIARRQLTEAGKEINDGLAAFPDNSQLLSQQMFLSLMLHNFADARRSYSRLQELPEPSFEASFHSCLYYYAIDQPSAARSYCAEAANHEPYNATAQANYGWVALDLGDFSVANQQFRKAWGLLTRPSARVGQTQEVDLIWGLILSAYFTGNKSTAREMFQLLRQEEADSITVDGLRRYPLVWSEATLELVSRVLQDRLITE